MITGRGKALLTKFEFVLLLTVIVGTGAAAQSAGSQANIPKPGIKDAQVPFASLKPTASIQIGGTADWVLVTDDAVWVASTKPYAVVRIDPKTDKIVAKIRVPGEVCSGLASGFGSIWAPICGRHAGLIRIDAAANRISGKIPIALAGPEGGITASDDSVWMVTDKNGTLVRISPSTNSLPQRISILAGSYNPIFSNGFIWITCAEGSTLTAVDASSGAVVDTVQVGPNPRFLTSGGGSIWTLNQGDGTVTRVDEKSREVIATILVGIPGVGGDIAYGLGSVWPTVLGMPLTQIDATTSKVLKQWAGQGGDSVRYGFHSIWLTDYKKGLLLRIPEEQLMKR